MTPDEIRNLPAGRELDAMVATRIMGLDTIPFDNYTNCPVCGNKMCFLDVRAWCYVCNEYRHSPYMEYSTDIAAAWEVVEMLESKQILFQICKLGFYEKELFWLAEFRDCSGGDNFGVGQAETAPLAVCRASLLAMEAQR